jgi:hypothetical protein
VLSFPPFHDPKAQIFMGRVGGQFCRLMLAFFGI